MPDAAAGLSWFETPAVAHAGNGGLLTMRVRERFKLHDSAKRWVFNPHGEEIFVAHKGDKNRLEP